jgi:hypothetical protein
LGLAEGSKIINGSLRIEKILDYTQKKGISTDSKEIQFIRYWHIAIRLLFSEHSISLRNVKPFVEAYRSPPTAIVAKLAAVLLQKLPMLGKFCCKKFAQHFLEYLTLIREEGEKALKASTLQETIPMKLLVKTALLDFERNNLCSFREFALNLKRSHKIHPTLRLAAWVTKIHQTCNVEIDQFSLASLNKLTIKDQAGFPLIEDDSNAHFDPKSCHTLSISGNFTDLTWMADTLTHGYEVNWEEVKKVWHENFVTSASDLEYLLSVCPVSGLIEFFTFTFTLPYLSPSFTHMH